MVRSIPSGLLRSLLVPSLRLQRGSRAILSDITSGADVRRSSYDELILRSPGLKPLLHVCAGCNIFGLRPGILETHHGDYGWRQSAAKYPELVLNDQCLCGECAP